MLYLIIAVLVIALVWQLALNWLFVNVVAAVGTMFLLLSCSIFGFGVRMKTRYIVIVFFVGAGFLTVGVQRQRDVLAAREAVIAAAENKKQKEEKAALDKAALSRKAAADKQAAVERALEERALKAYRDNDGPFTRGECFKSIEKARKNSGQSDGVELWMNVVELCEMFAYGKAN